MRFRVSVRICLKPGVLDPQGQTVEAALHSLGYTGVQGVGVGKAIEFILEASCLAEAESQVEGMCRQLLANPVMEQYEWKVESVAERASDEERAVRA
ncbi:MAG: phosphoribosylformylglycinamidine synthase subunit PurS [Limnochordaceae bacterium]|nr:phosphoribosylformylglycinamidine synthase subunit PurS [Limnochordaceae bacterium]